MRFGRSPIPVAGAEPLVQRIAGALRDYGREALALPLEDLDRLSDRSFRTLVLADPPDPGEQLRRLAEHRQQGPRTRGRRPLRTLRLILVHQADPPPPLPDLDPAAAIDLETFALEDRAARVLLARWPLHWGLDPLFGQVPHLLLVGFGPPARALLIQALRLIHYGEAHPRVSVAGATPEARARFLADYPQAPQVVQMDWLGRDLAGLAPSPPVNLVMVNPGTPGDPLATDTARAIAAHLAAAQGVSPPILLETGEAPPAGTLLTWDGQTFPYSYLAEACQPAVLFDGLGDELARSIHEQYTDSIAAQGRDPATEPAGQPWSRLSPSYRQANRHQADHVWAKLAVTDCRAVPEEQVETFAFAPLEAERLAVIEHQRWAADRHLDGWSYAPVRDNALKHHPQLIPYAALSEPMKDLDRFAVRGVPTLLARLGLGVVRLLILSLTPAAPGAADPSGADLPGLAREVFERLLTRYPDRSLMIATTLDGPISRTIARVGLDEAGAGLFLLSPRPISETLASQPDGAARLDLLRLVARAERRIALPGAGDLERWLAQRPDIALTVGTRTDDCPTGKRILLDLAAGQVHWNFDY